MTTTTAPYVVVMPRLSDQMEEAAIAQWLVAEGGTVEVGVPFVEIETDKAVVELEAEVSGVLQLVAVEGESVALNATIAIIHPAGTDVSQLTAPSASLVDRPSVPATSSVAPSPSAPMTTDYDLAVAPSRLPMSPLVRRLAREAGLDLAGIAGTGPRGRIRRADIAHLLGGMPAPFVETAKPVGVPTSPASAPLPERADPVETPFTRRQRIVVERMQEAKRTAPEFTASIDVDVTEIISARARLKHQGESAIPTINDFVVRGVALATRRHEKFRSSTDGERIVISPWVHVGIAVEDRGDLLVPVVRDADQRGVADISATTRALAAAVRDQTIRVDDLSGGTITVSNLGMFGIRSFQAILNMPQSAILAVGAVEERPVVRQGEIVVRHTMNITVTADHRIIYGADAARFLADVRSSLEEPLRLAF